MAGVFVCFIYKEHLCFNKIDDYVFRVHAWTAALPTALFTVHFVLGLPYVHGIQCWLQFLYGQL